MFPNLKKQLGFNNGIIAQRKVNMKDVKILEKTRVKCNQPRLIHIFVEIFRSFILHEKRNNLVVLHYHYILTQMPHFVGHDI